MGTYEMFWDCGFCGTTKLLGKSQRHCPSCGAPQDEDRRYFPAEHEKVAVEDHVFIGADVECTACGSPNSAAAAHCVGCGAPLADAEEVERVETVVAGEQSGTLEERRSTPPAPVRPPPRPTLGQRLKRTDRRVVIALVLVFAGLVTALLLWSRPTELTVLDHSWQRKVDVQEYSQVSGGNWCDSIPSDAYGISRSERVREVNRIPDGEECYEDCSTSNSDNGDGTFSQSTSCSTVCTTTYREEEVYDTWCDYTVDRWITVDTHTTSGEGLMPPPHWATPSVSNCASLGCTRIGNKRGTYTVHLEDSDGRDGRCRYDQDQWAAMPVGARYEGRKRVILGSPVCKALGPRIE